MTTPDHSALDAAVAAYEAAVAADDANRDLAYAAAQAQLTKLQANYDADQSEIADLQAQVADLQAKLDELSPPPAPDPDPVIYGSGIGGWFQAFSVTVKGKTYNTTEQTQSAFNRIQGFYGTLKAIRRFGSIPSYLDPSTRVHWDSGDTRPNDTQRQALNSRAGRQWLTVAHEVDLNDKHDANGNLYTPSTFAAMINAEAHYLLDHGYDNIDVVPLVTGSAVIPARQGSITVQDWFGGIDWTLPNVKPGFDLYQWGKSDTNCDTAAEVFQPAIDYARSVGKQMVVGEVGTRRVNPPYSPGISDGVRAAYIRDVAALCDANAAWVDVLLYFNSNNGSLGPWNLLAPPGCPDADYSPQANAAWADLCKR